MKSLYTLIGAMLLSANIYAQVPQGMSYQAVVRDANQSLVTNQGVGTRISILQGTPTGTLVYIESHNAPTNVNGLVTLTIGTGAVIGGDFSAIDWSAGPYFIKTETDPNGGTNYTVSGTTKMMSVPYALYAENSGTPGPQGLPGNDGAQGAPGANGLPGGEGPSAYQTWLNLGNQGSQADFIAYLVGADGASVYDIWLAQGNTGTQADFLTTLEGESAYQLWLSQGNSGTLADFIASLEGATGPQGIQGIAGPQGLTGPIGVDGESAYDIWLAQGNTGSETIFIASLQGATGAQGSQGVQGLTGPAGAVGPAGNNGVDGINGAQGPIGPAGSQGPQGLVGPQGPVGPMGTTGPAGPIAGSDQQINFNEGGNAGADAQLVFDKTSNHMAIGTPTVNPDAALEVNSTTGSFLMPRMTATQRDALSAVDGMLVFNSTDRRIQVFLEGGTNSDGNGAGVSFGYADNIQGNTFEVEEFGMLKTISASIANPAGNPNLGTTVYTMHVYDSQGGTLLATASNTFHATPGGYTGGNFDFTSAALNLSANTSYYFEITSDNISDFYLYASYSDNYTEGIMFVNGAFQAAADITFTVVSTSPDAWISLH
jgi:hypothetical protein